MAPATHGPPISEIALLWLTAGLSCDDETIAMTAATQPSLGDLLRGAAGFERDLADGNIRLVRPGMPVLAVSARSGEGLPELLALVAG